MMLCIYFYQYTPATIPPESFRKDFKAVAFSISIYQPVMHNHPKVLFTRHFGNKNLELSLFVLPSLLYTIPCKAILRVISLCCKVAL